MKPTAIKRVEVDEFLVLLEYLYKIYFKLPKIFFFFKQLEDLASDSASTEVSARKGLTDLQKKELLYLKTREEQQQQLLRYLIGHLIDASVLCTKEVSRIE